MRPPIHTPTSSVELQMTSMIDVVFLLLIFFLWTSSFDQPEGDLQSGLAVAATASGNQPGSSQTVVPSPFEELTITIISDSRSGVSYRLNARTINRADLLAAELAKIVTLGVQPPLTIIPLAGTTMEEAIQIHDLATAAGLNQIRFAVNDPVP
jgi:biopolymer transport protein ExbD